jgi:cellulose synthase/poly-beta-1,6-N-acetylglucosamine synthase-like glycosyltransferase
MITIVITSYNEPKATLKAVNVFLQQNSKEKFRVIVVDPHQEAIDFLKSHITNKNVEFFLDPGEGKSYALNLLIQENATGDKKDILIFTDGDVYASENALEEIKKAFDNPRIGCVTARPVSIDGRNTKYGYWANFAFEGVHRARSKLSRAGRFFECSGYLFAIRNSVIYDFPLETSEDSIIPYLFWKKGYKIYYAEKVEVYVKNPSNWQDWLAQKIRNIKGHENLTKIAPDMPRTKSLKNEILYGWYFLFIFPKNFRELWWTLQLYPARLYLYFKAFREIKKNKTYRDGWRGESVTESTKTLD